MLLASAGSIFSQLASQTTFEMSRLMSSPGIPDPPSQPGHFYLGHAAPPVALEPHTIAGAK